MDATYNIETRNSPIIATAIHDGHELFPDFIPFMMLKEHERFREEDPYTADIAKLPTSRVTVYTSRFQVDLNRIPEKAIYRNPEDAWGLEVWDGLSQDMEDFIMIYYQKFYQDIKSLIEDTIQRFGCFIVLDIHSYNYKREGPHSPASQHGHPDINLGTYYNRLEWHHVFSHLRDYLASSGGIGERVDARENVIFKGGAFAQWIVKHYGNAGCVVSIEYKKTFMDEWTGRANLRTLNRLRRNLQGALPLLYNDINKKCS